MADPHPQSVLDPSIANLSQDLYDKLTEMEKYTYNNSQQYKTEEEQEFAGFQEYSSYWQAYNNAIVGYMNSSLDNQLLKDFIVGLFSFLFHLIVNEKGNPAKKDESDAQSIFNLNGHIQTVLNYGVNYYDDYQYPTFDPSTDEQLTPESAQRLTADTKFVAGTEENTEEGIEASPSAWDNDVGKIESLQEYYVGIVSDGSVDAMFGNTPDEPKGEFDQQIAWDIIFDELNWQQIIEQFGFDFNVPPRPDKPPQPPSS